MVLLEEGVVRTRLLRVNHDDLGPVPSISSDLPIALDRIDIAAMTSAPWAFLVAVGLFAVLTARLELGYRLGRRHMRANPEAAHEGIGTTEAAVFALLGLLLGFSFAGGTSRLEARRAPYRV
jgi:hypothetical protein